MSVSDFSRSLPCDAQIFMKFCHMESISSCTPSCLSTNHKTLTFAFKKTSPPSFFCIISFVLLCRSFLSFMCCFKESHPLGVWSILLSGLLRGHIHLEYRFKHGVCYLSVTCFLLLQFDLVFGLFVPVFLLTDSRVVNAP